MMRGRTLHSLVLHALAPCSTLCCALLHSLAEERAPPALAWINPVLEVPHPPASNCLHQVSLSNLVSTLQILSRLIPTVPQCLTSPSQTHSDSAPSPTLT